MINGDAELYARGIAEYTSDIPAPENVLHAALLTSPVAHGKILRLNTKPALINGVIDVITAADIPGENNIGATIHDDPLLASDKVMNVGQPLAIVVATSEELARQAVRMIDLEIELLPPIFDPREAFRLGQLIAPPVIVSFGNIDQAWEGCAHIVEGTVETGGQEHVYLETQAGLVIPRDGKKFKVFSTTQSPSATQRIIAEALATSMNDVEVEVTRLGGAFGGKEDQGTLAAALAAVAAYKTKKPVKLVFHRRDDMAVTGKRHPYSIDFKLGLDADAKILAYDVSFFQNSGSSADLSIPIMERSLFHCNNTYSIPNLRARGICCRTNLPSNTAFRGFGAPQAMLAIECAIYQAAEKIGIDATVIQRRNLIQKNDSFHYGQRAQNSHAQICWQEAENNFKLAEIRSKVADFNATNQRYKRGIALMPICFGISFTFIPFNQANALVHIYRDGSVGVSSGAVEMGQGVNMKIRQVAARVFSIGSERICTEYTNTTRNANTSATAASTAADINGHATKIACEHLLERIKVYAAKLIGSNPPSSISIENERIFCNGEAQNLYWKDLVQSAYFNRINLSAHGYYATPTINFDKAKFRGEPYAYHVIGTAIVQATVDCLLGTYTIDSVKVVQDSGQQINHQIDLGQMEGGLVQGLSWLTLEELIHDNDGRLISDSLSTYKIPDIYWVPKDIQVRFLDLHDDTLAIYGSKACGEPPFLYGIAAYFALRNAIKAYSPTASIPWQTPITQEKILLALYPDNK